MQEKISNISRQMETLGKNQNKMLEIKTTIMELKTVFDGFICRLYAAKKRNSEFEDILIATSRTEIQRKKRMKKTEQNVQLL